MSLFVFNGYLMSEKGFSKMGGIDYGIIGGKGISMMGSIGHLIARVYCRTKGSEECLIAAIYS